MISRKKLNVPKPRSLVWQGDQLVDWVYAGNTYTLDGEFNEVFISFAFSFDSAIATPDGKFAVIYQKLGTKALLLKEGQIVRELNRSFYQAEEYEYPIAFLQLKYGEWAIVHCPQAYCQIDIELAETGELITRTPGRDPEDIFHSRLEADPTNQYILSAGWVWHPFDIFSLFKVEEVLHEPKLLDKHPEGLLFSAEVSSARFYGSEKVILSTFAQDSDSKQGKLEDNEMTHNQIGIYDLHLEKFTHRVNIDYPFGNIYPINDHYCWDLYQYPKVIDLLSGKIVFEERKDIPTSPQLSSIIGHIDAIPPVAQSPDYQRLAIGIENGIEVLTVKK